MCITAHAQNPLCEGMEQPESESCSSLGGVGLHNSLLCTAHAQIHCIKEWSNLKAARGQEEWQDWWVWLLFSNHLG